MKHILYFAGMIIIILSVFAGVLGVPGFLVLCFGASGAIAILVSYLIKEKRSAMHLSEDRVLEAKRQEERYAMIPGVIRDRLMYDFRLYRIYSDWVRGEEGVEVFYIRTILVLSSTVAQVEDALTKRIMNEPPPRWSGDPLPHQNEP